ncbi:hypothetical protein SODALDRAFT_61306 [Sodiomyces alkalinus F11]|uniref:dual-specificity kinase n=1 Tax=Sodiomyces alkalinus (strain CBS 110278 / VKM F-3762 / F11) TaxID=1314773 RepID=A0A3N2PLE7_SODAK|nr:hypothetical protein SODALDRAFT_61306 [Sodiomyces alkalinus F11]ROT35309.1 hypothetical protein SODALDRAFT_61306 [Sodiomyces alkalinus F11]
MVKEHRGPAGPRPANFSPTRRDFSATTRNTANTSPVKQSILDAPMLSASTSNHSLFSFSGRNGDSLPTIEPTGSFDFLPSVSFDDLQTSLESASTEFKLAQFPSPTGQGSILESQGLGSNATMADKSNPDSQSGAATISASLIANTSTRGGNPPPVSRPGRSGSILRRPSTSSRQPSISSTVSGFSAAGDNTSTGTASTRTRRQSHYPPVSSTNIGKPPRKSIGPGVIDGDYSIRTGQKRRPSLISNNGTGTESTRTSLDGNVGLGLGPARNLSGMTIANSRAAKARSVGQPLPRTNSSSLTVGNMLTPDHSNRMSTAISPRSPRVAGRGSAAPGSAQSAANQKRATMMSGMPILPHPCVATGLGARTISPTDTRRMKRMSMHQPQILDRLANAPPPPPSDSREQSRSPSMIPRKASATPSSSRTTPDTNRKSHQSGLSVGPSLFAPNSVRASIGPAPPRLSTSGSTSRLPTPKTLPPHPHSGIVADDHEGVPPVPAIPKAYESPKDTSADISFLDKRKATLAADASSIHSNNSTGSFSIPSGPETGGRVRRKASTRKSTNAAVPETEKKSALAQTKRHPAGLRLPPITVGPLNPSTAARVAALQEQGQSERNLSPPPSRVIAKTPSTPMTASRSTFFSRNYQDGHTEPLHFRSSSTVHHSRLDSASGAGGTSSSESIIGCGSEVPSRKPSMSPFLSSSVPRNGLDPEFIRRPKTGDIGNVTEPILDARSQQKKPSGPRAPKLAKSRTKSPPPASDPEEPPTPSSMSSLRRKLSLSWKRGTSKNGTTTNPSGAADKVPDLAKQDSMPPPRIPISATVGSLDSVQAPSPNTSLKSSGTYLESRRRKSSASGLQGHGHERTKSESLGQNGSPRREPGNGPAAAAAAADHQGGASRNASVMQRILRPKASASSIRQQDPWTAELDKHDLIAEDEMRKMGLRRDETEIAAKSLDALRKRATPKERVSAAEAVRIAMLNVYERGEIMDYDDVYFCGTQNAKKVVGDLQSAKPNFGYDDDRGDYTIVPGDHLSYRYEIIDVLGKGSFGQVVRCIDHKLGVLVAVKIIRNKKRFHQQALVEVNILQKIREWDPKNTHSMVHFTHSFYFRGHLCICTELLDMNLYEFIKVNSFRGFSLRLIRRFTKQILSSLNMLKKHKVIHCDLKPENILLRHPLHTEIKVIDFGSSCFENEKVYTYIQSRFYRSPEVILGMSYGLPIDMWSLGCILAELYTGVPIFPGEDEQEQLACIMEVFGPPEKHLIEKSTRKKPFFDSMGKPRLVLSSKGRRRRPSSKTLQQVLKCDDEPFLDFVARCLRWDPDRRLKPEDAIYHEFITGRKTSVPLPRVPARDSSPVKRHNTISTPRPLPEPPGGGNKGNGPSLRPREASGVSPHKPVSGPVRRPLGANGALHVASAKRTSTGPVGTVPGTSHLPRVAGRSVSAKQDLASAGAAAAMSRRA